MIVPSKSQIDRALKQMPDAPRWVETRSMLLGGWGKIYGEESWSEDFNFVVGSPELKFASVVGFPAREVLRRAISDLEAVDGLIAQIENTEHVQSVLSEWKTETALLHLLPDASPSPLAPERDVRLITTEELNRFTQLPAKLRDDHVKAARLFPVAAVYVDDLPVSFCYAVETESLWDISIETLEEHRNQGHAQASIAFMIRFMRERGKQPVWGAVESNAASLKLAAKLGFEIVESVNVFQPA
ncbi:MAG: GNAT family N-acetyltransferase [Pyrinomonadaceae bacterium]|nr:GNAT family N-acetyltransferase [Pyrinomonadaceae bacterium]